MKDPQPKTIPVSHNAALALSAGFIATLAAFTLLPQVRRDVRLVQTFLAAAGALLVWSSALFFALRRTGRSLLLEINLRKQHYIQACAQGAVLLYWGWYVRSVYDYVPLIAAQLVFAYAFDCLLSWSRRNTYVLGFGPFPVIFSINLFLWFKPEWFYFQFAMVALGFLAKELIRWNREGRRVHVFNPSSFPLAVFSLALLLTGTTDMTWGVEIAATQFNPPHIYLAIFLVALPGQLLFGVTTMTMAAVISSYIFGLLYFAATGTYFFRDAYIPIAVFLGMHLLFTDPSTSPRTESGRIIFGVLYGLGTIALAALLDSVGEPNFYDKLLPVPIMNLLVIGIDRLARAGAFRIVDPSRLGQSLSPARRRFAYVCVWAGVFAVLSAVDGVGDDHRGQYLPFWQQACDSGRERACEYLAFMKWNYCDRGSGWACNEFGVHRAGHDRTTALRSLRRGCALGFSAACENVRRLTAGAATLTTAAPRLIDLPIVLRGSKGPVRERTPEALYALACERGWPHACDGPPKEVLSEVVPRITARDR